MYSIKRSFDLMDLWAVVNNAGVASTGQIEWMSMDEYQRVMDVNYFGVIRVTKAFLPLVRKCRGRVVNVASVAGCIAADSLSAYASSKHAVLSFTDSLRREMFKFDVKVSAIIPFFFKTDLSQPERVQKAAQQLWDKTDDKIKATYGQAYFERLLRSTNKLNKIAYTDISIVIDAMVHAITREVPQNEYVVPWTYAFWLFLIRLLPHWFGDMMMRTKKTFPTEKSK